MYRPETYLPWPIPGTGLIIAIAALMLLGFLTANFVGRTLVMGRGPAQPYADRAADLQNHETDLRRAVLEIGFELPAGGPGGVSGPRHVVAGVSVAAAERRSRGKAAARRACFGVHALHAQPDHRLLLLRAAQGSH